MIIYIIFSEEIFSSHKALWVSENEKYIAYASFNDTKVPVMSIPFYGRPGTRQSQYTLSWDVRYPKVSTPTSQAPIQSRTPKSTCVSLHHTRFQVHFIYSLCTKCFFFDCNPFVKDSNRHVFSSNFRYCDVLFSSLTFKHVFTCCKIHSFSVHLTRS